MNVFKLFGEISIDKSGAIKGIKEVEGQASKSSLAMQKTFNKLAKVAKVAMIAGAVAATAAVVKMTKDSIKAFAEFEEGMNEVFTLLPDITEDAMDSMRENVKSLAKEMGILPDEIVPALYQAISAGVPRENVFTFMEVASKAAIGGVTDIETAVDGLTSTINAYGKENITAGEAADILFTAVRLGKTTMKELSDRLFQVNPIAAALGINFGDVAAAMAEITATGVPTRVAATQLRQMLMELSKAGSDVAVTFENVAGKSFQDFIAEGHNLGEALQLLADYAEENDIKMQDMFGSVEAGQAVLALTGIHADSYIAKIKEMDNAAGATDAAYATMAKGMKRSWDRLMAWWKVVKIDVGTKLQEPIERVLTWIEDHREEIEEGIMSIFDGLIEGAEWIMDHADGVARGLKAIAIGFGLIIAVKFALWVAPAISSIAKLALVIGGTTGGGGLVGVLGILGTTLLATAAIILVYKQKTGESADITRDLTDETIALMELDWLALREDILGIADAAGITEEDLFGLTDALETAFLAAIEAPDPATARKLYSQYVSEIFAVYDGLYPELRTLKEKHNISSAALDEAAATARVELEERTGYDITEIAKETNEEIIVDEKLAQLAIIKLARFGADARKTLMGEEKAAWIKILDKVRENAEALKVGTDSWINYIAAKIEAFSKNVIDRFTNMFTTNLQAEADYNVAVKKLNDDFITDKQQLTTDYKTELGKLKTAYDSNELTHEQYIDAKATAEWEYLGDLKELEKQKAIMMGKEEQAYKDQRVAIADVLRGLLVDFFNYVRDYFAAKAAAALAEAIILTIPAPLVAAVKYGEALAYGAAAVAASVAGWVAAAETATDTTAPVIETAPTGADALRDTVTALASRASGMSSVTSLGPEIEALWYNAQSVLGAGHAALTRIQGAYTASRNDDPSAVARELSAAATMFAEGGLIGKISEPILAMLGEGRHEEVVLPLSKPVFRELGTGIIEALSGIISSQPALAVAGGGDITINIDNLAVREEADVQRVAVHMMDLVEEERRAQGRDSLIGG